jgi:hypothetical protein
VQLLVGDFLVVLGIVAFPDDRGLVAALLEMAVDAVEAGIERAVLEPFDRDVARRVGVFFTLVKGLIQVMRLACSPQNLFGSAIDAAYISLYLASFAQARFAQSAGMS